mmetsp:Transcript_49514/g.127798  ORF Transcript_49514/g.127798 Transcript_49514/m.127798 type:complete len:231 (-) Transcript_49514:348-1040(-)
MKKYAGSSELSVTLRPASTIGRTAFSPQKKRGYTWSRWLEHGQSVSGVCALRSRSMTAGSWNARTPWSTRSIFSSSRASVTYEASPSSPACATHRRPASRARAYTSLNLPGRKPSSALSRPTPSSLSRCGSARSSTLCASSADRSRRKHMISRPSMLRRARPSSRARCSPLTTVSNGRMGSPTPLASKYGLLCTGTPLTFVKQKTCGSKNISACRTWFSAARSRYVIIRS